MVRFRIGCAFLLAASAGAAAQPSVAINLAGVRIQNGLNQSRSSAPGAISPAFRYHYAIAGMVHGTGLVLGGLFPSSTPLSQVLETLSPGSSSVLSGDFDNCPGTHPITPPPQITSGSQVLAGITVNYAMTISFQIDSAGVASFSLTNVVLTPALLVGSLVFDSGSATLTRVYQCPPNCDGSTAPPVLNVADFTCFLQRFAAGETYANCDCSTDPPALNVADFTCFLQRFAGGCPPP
jgi:hypothetical protein